jgi:hypothetical protein
MQPNGRSMTSAAPLKDPLLEYSGVGYFNKGLGISDGKSEWRFGRPHASA